MAPPIRSQRAKAPGSGTGDPKGAVDTSIVAEPHVPALQGTDVLGTARRLATTAVPPSLRIFTPFELLSVSASVADRTSSG